MMSSIFHKWFAKRGGATSSKVSYFQEEYRNLKDRSFSTHTNSFNAPFSECFRSVLFIVQLTGLLPLDYLTNGAYRFRIVSIKFLYSCFVGLVILFLSILSLMKALHDNMEFDKIITFMFYSVDFLVVLQLQVLAVQWPNIIVVWRDFERTLDQNEQLLGKRYSLKVLFQLMIVSVTAMTVVNEILGVLSGMEKGRRCVGVEDEMQGYFRQAFPQIFLYVDYALWKGVLMQFVQFFCTFVRMFLDLFLIFISLGLCRLIERLNLQYGLPRSNRTLTDEFWVRYKDQYLQFMNLVGFVDKRIGHVTILCFLSDLYLICIRILNSLKSMDTARQAVYFWYALLFLIMRLVFVCFFASNLHLEAKRPLTMLCKVPAACWSLEAQRFQDLVTHNDVCLTGLGYFKLRRTLLLSVRGTFSWVKFKCLG